MSYVNKTQSTRISAGDIAELKKNPITLPTPPFSDEHGPKLDKANPFAILEPLLFAASEPTLRALGKQHLAEKFRTPDGIRNAQRIFNTQLKPILVKLALAANAVAPQRKEDV